MQNTCMSAVDLVYNCNLSGALARPGACFAFDLMFGLKLSLETDSEFCALT